MNTYNTQDLLERVYGSPEAGDIQRLLSLKEDKELDKVFNFADKIRKRFCKEGILLRGIVEFSNYCRNNCYYCGLNKNNKTLERYRLTIAQILDSVQRLYSCGIKTVVLQSGEDSELDAHWLKEIIAEIKLRFDIAITLSVGERRQEEYKIWKEAGADRYLLKIETSDKKLYQSLHPGMSFEGRINCLRELKELGFQVGSGNIIGLKGQTLATIAKDILFFRKEEFDMIGIGPFIPHRMTPLSGEDKGDLKLTLKTVALTRIVTRYAHLPATTALGSLGDDYRAQALRAGANVLMPNFTPQPYRRLYEIYPGKRCIDEPSGSCGSCMELMASSIGRTIDYSRGYEINRDSDSFRSPYLNKRVAVPI
jgi:biotin synthase